MSLLLPDGNAIREGILCIGGTSVVVRRGDVAIKLPLKYDMTGLDEARVKYLKASAANSSDSIQRELKVYRRLGPIDGIVPFLDDDRSGVGIHMAFMQNGSLVDFLRKNSPDRATQLKWFREMAHTLVHIHDRRVIVADIASRNFLLAADLSIKFSDFGESTLLPLHTNIETVDDSGYSIYTDIGQLGSVMFEVLTGTSCKFDLYKDKPFEPVKATWPQREDLPETEGIWLGSIIETCWTKGAFQNACDLVEALNLVVLE
jgi:serine/threonine protein kinase